MVRRATIVAVGLLLASVAWPAGRAGAAAGTVRLSGSAPIVPAGLATSDAVSPDERLSVQVHLRLRDQAAADALALAVSTPGSPQYGEFLAPHQFRARYSPTAADAQRVAAWLTGQGLEVTAIPDNRFFVRAEGTTAQVAAAFATELVTVEANGQRRRVNLVEPAVPAELAASIEGVTGLSQVMARPTRVGAGDELPARASAEAVVVPAGDHAPPSPGFRNAAPCSDTWAALPAEGIPAYGGGYPDPLPWAPCGWKPEQLRSAYDTASAVAAGVDGRGVTVAVVGAFASPTIFQDASTYAVRNDPAHPLERSQFRRRTFRPQRLQQECDIQGWYGEQTLDVEAVHAMAPGADILYVGSRSCEGDDFNEALNDLVDHHRADIVSNSYGFAGELLPPAVVQATLKLHTQAAAQGIGFYYSSGDDGDYSHSLYGGPVPSAGFEASSPLSTAVGGTSLGIDANGAVAVEQGWTTGVSDLDAASGAFDPGAPGRFLYGAGGGPSRLFEQPGYQAGVVPAGLAGALGAPARRVVPDVGMVGDPNTGFLVGQTQTFPEGVAYDEYRIGGTSLSAPLFAGVMALADQQAGSPHGFANPWLYSLAGTPAFRDITPGPPTAVARRNFVNGVDDTGGFTPPSVRTFDADLQTLRTLDGYDTLTGLGAPNGAGFLNAA